ncbi:hypothetical protein E3N88_12998 [Mikania micrantha]|uniref:Uncharacterized protein n=1 Tax=Mikania micrantha TaxID=192012 RepID=A0A5N6P8E3_9ASTR|nr:hypothetical protein E3N88_12998 [Mikania micrantha]
MPSSSKFEYSYTLHFSSSFSSPSSSPFSTILNVKNDERGRKPCAKRSSYAPGIAKRSLNQKWDENRVRRIISLLLDLRDFATLYHQYLYHDIKVLILELYLVNPCVAEQKTLIVLSVDTPFTGRIASPLAIKDNGEDALTALATTNFVYSAMANPGENYIYQRFPYIILDDTPSDSSGSSSGAVPSHASSVSSQVGPQLPATPPGSPFIPPPPPGSPPVHSPPHSPPWF